jgi:hypothetical protein
MSLEMAHKVIVPQKKIMSRSFLNSGTLIVITYLVIPGADPSCSTVNLSCTRKRSVRIAHA